MNCLACSTKMIKNSAWQAQSREGDDIKHCGFTFSLFSNVRRNIVKVERKRITLDVYVCPNCGEVRLKMKDTDLNLYKRTCSFNQSNERG